MALERLPPKPGAWTITKRQVVATELTQALRLYVVEDDSVSAHLLCGAARDIIHALSKIEGNDKVWNHLVDHIVEDKQRAFYAALKEEYNFFKHADPNCDMVTKHYRWETTSYLLWETCIDVEYLFGKTFIETQMFQFWFFSWHPHMVQDEYAKKLATLRESMPDRYDAEGRMTFATLRQAFELFAGNGARKFDVKLPFLADERAKPPK